MKIIVPIVLLALCATIASGFALIPQPPATNGISAPGSAMNLNAPMQNYYFLNGKVERMEHEIDRLQDGFVALAVLAGAAITALCLLAARDALTKKRRVPAKLPAESPADGTAVPARI